MKIKHNLKNRPKLDEVYDYDDASRRKAVQRLYELNEYCDNLEKELRELFDNNKGLVSVTSDEKKKDVLIGIKEILGEDS